MDIIQRNIFIAAYRDSLLRDTIPFWLKHAPDFLYGGCFTQINRDGSILDTDKSIANMARFSTLLGELCLTVESREDWAELTKSIINFLKLYAISDSGTIHRKVTREGRPLYLCRNLHSAVCLLIAFATYAKAIGSPEYLEKAVSIYQEIISKAWNNESGDEDLKCTTRVYKKLVVPLLLIEASQTIRKHASLPDCDAVIDLCISEITREFLKPNYCALIDSVGLNGEFYDHIEGRLGVASHGFKAAKLLLYESVIREGDSTLRDLGVQILDWTWRKSWDEENGGLFPAYDVRNMPLTQARYYVKYSHTHCQAIIATLTAAAVTADDRFYTYHHKIHDWSHKVFPDSEHGEWIAFVNKTGQPEGLAKAYRRKPLAMIAATQLHAWRLLERGCDWIWQQ